ncbi:MAG: putative DNA-binding domain-containing protein [Cyanobacteria bacterium HKST-UBA02]|nr:putative DNA-binding domain-containing protein [Cyanobacteria bacterium HKST-UBA02]
MTEAATLKEIEESLHRLWTTGDARRTFLSGDLPEGVHQDVADKIDPDGVSLYSSLIRLGQKDLMLSIYPGCARVIGRGFEELIYQYMETYPAEHFNFNRAANRFSIFLKEHCPRLLEKFPFLPELADYEWIELEVLEHPADQRCVTSKIALSSPEDFSKQAPRVNPTLILRSYQYPIDKIVDWLRDDVRLPRRIKKAEVCLAVYRSAQTNSARFLALSPVAARLIETASESPTSFAELVSIAVSENPEADPQTTVLEFLELIEKLENLELLSGSASL